MIRIFPSKYFQGEINVQLNFLEKKLSKKIVISDYLTNED